MTKQIKPLKKYGQNFLQNRQIAEKIVAALNCGQEDNILEIGAGEGVLTEHLIRHKHKSITVIEIDQRLVKLLEEKFSGYIDIGSNNVCHLVF